MDGITFNERDANHVCHPHCNALVVKAMIANNNIHRMLVDNGSSVDILYYQAFQRMGLKVSDLKPSPNPIYGFMGDSIIPLGVISLPMTLSEYPRQSCVMADLLVIDQPLAFNVVLGRPSLRELKTITSIVKVASKSRQFHIVNQRPLNKGLLDDTIDPRSLYEEGTTGPIEDLADLPVDDQEPSKVLKIRKNLSEEVRKAILEFLRRNLDMFAWVHSDMEGIKPSIISHCLNIDQSRKPIRHKIQAMDAERY